MEWEREAVETLEAIPLPPIMAPLAKLDAEMRARRKGLNVVSTEIVRETEAGYRETLGSEAMQALEKMMRGEDVGLPDEFFEQIDNPLMSIQLCPAKFGACTLEKRDMMLAAYRRIKEYLLNRDISGIMLARARPPLMSHHAFRVAIIGCPNCCLSPWLSDFGVVGVFRPGVKPDGCIQCGECVTYCSEGAIRLNENGPVIDYGKCVACGGCGKICPEEVLYTEKAGYRVAVGGSGSRHPRLAETVTDLADIDGVIRILDEALTVFEEFPEEGREPSFHDAMSKEAVKRLKRKAV